MNNPEVLLLVLVILDFLLALIASNNIKVYGVDIDVEVVKTINRGDIYIVEPKLDTAVRSNVQKGRLTVSNKPIESNTFVTTKLTPLKVKMSQIFLMFGGYKIHCSCLKYKPALSIYLKELQKK